VKRNSRLALVEDTIGLSDSRDDNTTTLQPVLGDVKAIGKLLGSFRFRQLSHSHAARHEFLIRYARADANVIYISYLFELASHSA